MKAHLLLFFILVSLLFFSCQQNKAKAHQDAIEDMMDKYGDKKRITNRFRTPNLLPMM